MTRLNYIVERVMPGNFSTYGKPLVMLLVPLRDGNTLLVLRLKGQRVGYVVHLADVYRLAALWHGNKERQARAVARKNGVPWRIARKQFNTLPPIPRRVKKKDGSP
jgi:hypothetical protein